MTLLFLVACGPELLATIPGATRLSETASGELLVGTVDGDVWIVDAFGGSSKLAHVDGPVQDVVANPLGVYDVVTRAGRHWQGTLWTDPVGLGDVLGVYYGCEGLEEGVTDAPGLWSAGVSAVAIGSRCDERWLGFGDGRIATMDAAGVGKPRPVAHASIVRVEAVGSGALWVAADGTAGCAECALRAAAIGVVDAWQVHQAPFVEGEQVWIDASGGLWIR